MLPLLQPDAERISDFRGVHEIEDQLFEQDICSNRTCELGMNLATGKDYRSVIFLLEELTRPVSDESPRPAAQDATAVA